MIEHATMPPGSPASALPAWHTVLAVVAHPDDGAFGLGAVLDAFRSNGTTVALLCLTHGETTGLRADGAGGPEQELADSARELGLARTRLLHHPDGMLSTVARHLLADDVIDEVGAVRADGLLVYDRSGVSGHADHAAATSAALLAAAVLDLPVLGWTIPQPVAARLNDEYGTSFAGQPSGDVELGVAVDRTSQLRAVGVHADHPSPSNVLWRRLELLGDVEYLRWLHRPEPEDPQVPAQRMAAEDRADTILVRHRSGDGFEVRVRGHTLLVDQPEQGGGEDTGPAPVEVFVAGLASCVASHVRRYLSRHRLPTRGLVVAARYTLGGGPSRVTDIELEIEVPDGVPPARIKGLQRVASHCTARNTLVHPPPVAVTVAAPRGENAGASTTT
jgi:LmbE family N-acetylglucosaminyl deacetylase/uncharacterized OsmC-like protein